MNPKCPDGGTTNGIKETGRTTSNIKYVGSSADIGLGSHSGWNVNDKGDSEVEEPGMLCLVVLARGADFGRPDIMSANTKRKNRLQIDRRNDVMKEKKKNLSIRTSF